MTRRPKSRKTDSSKPKEEEMSDGILTKNDRVRIDTLSKLIVIAIPVANAIPLAIALFNSNSNEQFYGIDHRYFYSTSKAIEMVITFIMIMAIFVLTLEISRLKSTFGGRWSIALAACSFIWILFQEILGLLILFQRGDGLINDAVAILGFALILASSAEMSFYLSIDEAIISENTREILLNNKIIVCGALTIYVIMFMSISVPTFQYQSEAPGKKTVYEMTENGDAIVSEYNGDYVVMHCREEDGLLVIDRGICYMKEITGIRVTRKEFNEVICK